MPSIEIKSTIAQELIECLGDAIAKVTESETQDELLYFQQEIDIFISGLLAEKPQATPELKTDTAKQKSAFYIAQELYKKLNTQRKQFQVLTEMLRVYLMQCEMVNGGMTHNSRNSRMRHILQMLETWHIQQETHDKQYPLPPADYFSDIDIPF
jgi:hypothetical protein